MKRWQAAQFGEAEDVLELQEVPLPDPGAGEARVRVLTASVALPDVMMLRGEYPLVPAPPVSPGQEVVGIVDAVGEGFPYPPGTRIVGGAHFDRGMGGLAEYALVPGWSAMTVMEGLSDEQAVGFVGSFHVAHIGLQHRAGLRAGDVLLVLGGAGRTGSAAIQVGKALGATVIATARSKDKAQFCEAQGADLVVDLDDPSTASAIDELTGGHGVDVVYDTVGGEAYTKATTVLASPGARVLLVGFASGSPAHPDGQDLLLRDYSVIGTLSSFRNDTERAGTLEALSAMLAAGQIDPPVSSVHAFKDVPEAMARRATDALGQTVVKVASPEHT